MKWVVSIILAWVVLLAFAFYGPAAVTQIGGLAVAQTGTQWNNLKDMAAGDGLANGAGMFTPCLWNGTTCDRQRGSIAGGADVAIRSLSTGTVPADGFTNPSNSLTVWSLGGLFNGTTWDRARAASADSLTTGLTAGGGMVFNNTNWDRQRGIGGLGVVLVEQSRIGRVTEQAISAANAAVSITLAAGGPVAINMVNGLDAYCSAGTSTITISRATGPTTIWSTPTGAVTAALFSKEFPVPIASTVAAEAMTVTLAACGVGNTGTLMVRGGQGFL